MTGDESTRSDDISEDDDHIDPLTDDEISKSQRKRDADAVRDLGTRLTELANSELATVPLPDDVASAIEEYSRIKSNGARKRQLGFLAKRLRHVDVEPIEAALEKLRQAARANTITLHLIEQWRDRLLGDAEEESAKDALTTFLTEFKSADRQQFRHLQQQALKERKARRSPAAARQLFKAIRAQISTDPDEEY